MSTYFAGPAMAKLVAQQTAQDQTNRARRGRPVRPSRAERRARRVRQPAEGVARTVQPGRLTRVVRSLRLAH